MLLGRKVNFGQSTIVSVRRFLRCFSSSDKETRFLQLYRDNDRREDMHPTLLSGKDSCLVVRYKCLRLIKSSASLGNSVSCVQRAARNMSKQCNLPMEFGTV